MNPLDRYHAIGIILAGGGAKGAYQAGALKAIHEFLTRHNAHGKVRMLAGTSIGSWNAMFWLAGLIEAPGTSGVDLEKWWTSISIFRVVRPALYIPAFTNYFLSPKPWKKTFDSLFKSDQVTAARLQHHLETPDGEGSIRFYFTRSNVARAHLEVTTNRKPGTVQPNLPKRAWQPRVRRAEQHVAATIDDLRTAVFSSMDLPPLFEYSKIHDDYFEDGGVIDNLPIQFGTEAEQCDLLFILPLNATFAQDVDRRSIIKRLWRVMDVRQGVLERNSFKMVYLYNELCALRHNTEMLKALLQRANELLTRHAEDHEVQALSQEIRKLATAPASTEGPEEDAARCALMRRHERVQVFAICPGPKLAINTTQFWKTKAAGQAFRMMRKATSNELDRFFAAPPESIRLALVQPAGDILYLEDF